MRGYHNYCLFFILSFLFCIICGEYLEERKVIYLDRTPAGSGIDNYLFRGNEPKLNVNGVDVVAYDVLKSYLINASQTQGGFQLPSDFYLIDIKFVYDASDPAEKGDIILEQNYFDDNPEEGEYHTHVILGDLEDPSIMNNKTVVEKAKSLPSWQHDNLPSFIPSIHNLLYTKRNTTTVIYFHCECGCDRTGEIGASYAMKYLNKNYNDVTQWNKLIAGRSILPNHQFAIHWYCLYLILVENSPISC